MKIILMVISIVLLMCTASVGAGVSQSGLNPIDNVEASYVSKTDCSGKYCSICYPNGKCEIIIVTPQSMSSSMPVLAALIQNTTSYKEICWEKGGKTYCKRCSLSGRCTVAKEKTLT